MIKKYEGGSYPITEETVRFISSLTLIPFEDIVFGNLDDLEPGSLVLEQGEVIDLEDKELLKDFANDIAKIFPLFLRDDALKNPFFDTALNICNEKLIIANFKEEDMVEAIDAFLKFDCPESYLNIMSLLGRLFVTYIYNGMPQDAFDKIKAKRINNMFEYSKKMHERINYNKEFMEIVKRKFLDGYNGLLTTCMKRASEEDKYKDYVYYYLGVRYYFGIMDNEITKMSDTEMNLCGISMLDCLKKIENKYAIEFEKVMKF